MDSTERAEVRAGIADLDVAIADLRATIARGGTRLTDGTSIPAQLARLIVDRHHLVVELDAWEAES